MTALAELPTDVLYNIFPYLEAADFLALTSTTKVLQTYRQDPNFWRSLTRTTFRIPPQPLLQADGARWEWLYRRLRTQTRLYTWGSNGCGNLGHGIGRSNPQASVDESDDSHSRSISWPRRVLPEQLPEDIGIIADVQCGGWSTTLLNSRGCLYICGGVKEASAFRSGGSRRPHGMHGRFATTKTNRRLTFPSAYPITTKHRYEPSTAIAQFSSGRKHILGLADDGKVWQWVSDEARLIKPLHVDVGGNRVARVVAGWEMASMYIAGTGIIYWPDNLPFRSASEDADALLVDTATIPGTSFLRSTAHEEETLQSRIGQVANHIALENYIIFTTKLNKVFLYRLEFPLPDLDPPEPIELTAFYPTTINTPFEVRDLQGSFRSFAIFTVAGAVLIGNRAMLDAFHATSQPETPSSPPNPPLPQPKIIPALQNNSIISIAFGDHHFQALRSDGTILSLGNDPQACGALGLGFPNGSGPLRGLMRLGYGTDASLREHEGREVWFDPTMHRWLADMRAKALAAQEGDEAHARGVMVLGGSLAPRERLAAAITATGDYFEREGRRWEDGVRREGEMGGYFVLKVAAAGWHSAALVLVDEEMVERAREMHVLPVPSADEAGEKEEEDDDGHGGTWEDVDAPWDQLSKALMWVWGLARWFLGLAGRDARLEAEVRKGSSQAGRELGSEREGEGEGEGEGGERDDAVRYTWSERLFPRLRMADGEVMPGEIEITE